MNYAALLGVLAAVTFTLPLLARLAEMLGLHRGTGVAASLGIAALAAVVWYLRASGRRLGKLLTPSDPLAEGRVDGTSSVTEEDDASVQGRG